MPKVATPRWWKIMAFSSVLIGPLLLALRLGRASGLEKFVYLTIIYPLALFAFSIRYVVSRKSAVSEADPQLRRARLDELRREFRILMFVLIPASLIGIAVTAWLLFIRLPGQE